MDVVLASKSPRRRELLAKAGVNFRIIESQASEDLSNEAWSNPEEAVQTLAERKAGTVVQDLIDTEHIADPTVVIGADTIVVLDGKVYGKPTDANDARRMLHELEGKCHQVITGVSVYTIQPNTSGAPAQQHTTFAETSNVYFKALTDEDISAYLAEGESLDKAGAYAIQGKGQRLVDHYAGSWDNIVGLPVQQLLERFPSLVNKN